MSRAYVLPADVKARTEPRLPTSIELPSPREGTDLQPDLDIELLELRGNRSVGGGGDPGAVTSAVQSKGGRMEGTKLILPALPASIVTSGTSISTLAEGIMAATVNASRFVEDPDDEQQKRLLRREQSPLSLLGLQ